MLKLTQSEKERIRLEMIHVAHKRFIAKGT